MLNLVVVRSANPAQLVAFYQALGLTFKQHQHGDGPEHWACEEGAVVFEIYPLREGQTATKSLRLGFRVASVADAVTQATGVGARLVSAPQMSEWGLRAVIADPDGNRVELTEPPRTEG